MSAQPYSDSEIAEIRQQLDRDMEACSGSVVGALIATQGRDARWLATLDALRSAEQSKDTPTAVEVELANLLGHEMAIGSDPHQIGAKVLALFGVRATEQAKDSAYVERLEKMCLEDGRCRCEGCNLVFDANDGCWWDDDGTWLCKSCAQAEAETSDRTVPVE